MGKNIEVEFPEYPPVPKHSHQPGPILFGIMAFFVLACGVGFLIAFHHLDQYRRMTCQTGNERSQLQMEDYVEQRQLEIDDHNERLQQLENFDFRTLGVKPENVEEIRALSIANAEIRIHRILIAADRRISRVPFQDCETSEKSYGPNRTVTPPGPLVPTDTPTSTTTG